MAYFLRQTFIPTLVALHLIKKTIMKTANLFFATNRKHEGKQQWTPKTYGERFSSDGHQNLRFGQVTVTLDEGKLKKHLNHVFKNGRTGDGEALSSYFCKQSKKGIIKAYPDFTASANAPISSEDNASTQFFFDLKTYMMDATDVVVYIHGYNVSWDEAVGSALALEFMLNSQNVEGTKKVKVVLFSWPSNGSMMPYAAYKSDRTDARDSGKAVGRALLKLQDFLATLHQNADNEKRLLCGNNLHLLCHSMGNYLLQKALEDKVIGYLPGQKLPRIFKSIFLCAADVNDHVLEGGDGMARLHEMGNNVSVYYNQGDVAMYISKYTKSLTDKLGQVGNAHPALVHNKVHQIDCSPIVKGLVEHSYYLWATVNRDIWQTINDHSFDNPQRNRKRNAQNREWVMT